ncbi:MAG TPA: NAD(P)H-hydrate dehydratase [Burkholderiales bacterium]|nr:NAD(P)H-hydrate dehydratase [Burkholderiales bacterium]
MPYSPIYSTAAIRKIESRASGAGSLMERAGAVAAEFARSLCGDTARDILVVAGPGNNGGDAFEVAAHLKRWFFRVSVVFAGERARLPRDAAAALAKWEAAGGTLLDAIPESPRFGLVVDGLFGIGLKRPLAGDYGVIVDRLNALGVPILSLDIPSGIDADTGAVMGRAVRARHTITFIAYKPGQLTLDGPDHCGGLKLDTLGLDPAALLEPEGLLLDAGVLAAAIAPRPRNFHKGQAGSVGILGGAAGMVGAAVIAGRAALRCGAGRVYLGLLTPRPPHVDYAHPELMLRQPGALLEKGLVDVLVAGPGMGKSDSAKKALRAALAAAVPIVLDADALNLIAAGRPLSVAAGKRKQATLMTPHPAEAARLLGKKTGGVQADRVAAARAIALRYQCLVVLKGNGSVIAAPDGKFWINPTGNPGMASAGMGDALAGIVAALCAQGAAPLSALLAGTYLHGAAADALVAAGSGPVGITASEVIDSARSLLNAAR